MELLYGSVSAINAAETNSIALFRASSAGVLRVSTLSTGYNKIPSSVLTSGVAELSSGLIFSNSDNRHAPENRPASISSFLFIKY
jgi:hypothetical protein